MNISDVVVKKKKVAEREPKEQVSNHLPSMVPASAPAWVHALNSLNDGVRSGHVSQINYFLPKLLLAMVFVTAVENELIHLSCLDYLPIIIIISSNTQVIYVCMHVCMIYVNVKEV